MVGRTIVNRSLSGKLTAAEVQYKRVAVCSTDEFYLKTRRKVLLLN